MAANLINPNEKPTVTFDWGLIKPLVAKDDLETGSVSMMHVVVFPGGGHDRHNHPESDEILFFLSGEGEQMVDDGEPFTVGAGDSVLIPKGVWHSTFNIGWEPLVVLAIYTPAGPEQAFPEIPGFRELPGGVQPILERG
jgi:mannose-6-phosphate isomerase-like protein (cupin superfamily)